MNPNKASWEKGDFTEIAACLRQSGEAVVQSLGITPPLRALDLGCGDGATAMPLALLGTEVTGIDIARNLVKAGNRRAPSGSPLNVWAAPPRKRRTRKNGSTSIPARFLRVTVSV
jgi:2-polyprenyl-3-methyl-5-hydroxy-6-metoxy-1,4-benzoquinol methylase